MTTSTWEAVKLLSTCGVFKLPDSRIFAVSSRAMDRGVAGTQEGPVEEGGQGTSSEAAAGTVSEAVLEQLETRLLEKLKAQLAARGDPEGPSGASAQTKEGELVVVALAG